MVGIYMSGTGNSRYCIEKLISLLEAAASIIPIEDDRAAEAIRENEMILLAYPVQFSNVPMMVRDFVKAHAGLWQGKQILCVATMGAFSGDGAGCAARVLKRYGASILGGLHLRMPDSVCDVKLLKKSTEENRRIVLAADRKMTDVAVRIKAGQYPQEGLGFMSRAAGLLGQRIWYYGKTRHYSHGLKISEACICCGQCASLCPMKNMVMQEDKPVSLNRCTMCYRCISRCPQKAITLLGKEIYEQCRIERYLQEK